MLDVVALGELLIDFTPILINGTENAVFERNPGGAPANVLTVVAKFGGKTAFIGKVGNDNFGLFLKDVLEQHNICTRGLMLDKAVNTTLAFVHLDKNGDRSFSFYRNPGADYMLSVEELDLKLIHDTKIFHFSSISMTNEPGRSATIKAAEYARHCGKIVSFDPNWRPPLWKNVNTAKEVMGLGLKYADIVKVSEYELEMLSGESDFEIGSDILLNLGVKLVFVTLGPKGCFYKSKKASGKVNTYDTCVVDTTGAGDAFIGGVLYHLSKLNCSIEEIGPKKLEEIVDFSNAVGALCATKRGGIPSVPSLEQVKHCIGNVKKLII